ncbi:serpin family protein [Cellulomonas palmilytica]|uniref:serpin family protein n=1 Tax=Cellulomonas palmilytica TaxID=2608402 RepID=UPI001F4857B8|nr:serpin family protein [Cellulomonas palmilytica]UJP39177.1 serpin family protein [Cellulomonas palmilytica]
MRASWAVVVVGVFALTACGSQAEPRAEVVMGEGEFVPVALADASAAGDVVAASWELGFLALRAGQDDEAGGVVVSPSSLVSALAMVAEGAVGEEAAPFDAALGASGDDRTDAVSALLAALARYEGDPATVQDDELPATPVLHTAQRVVLDDGAVPRQEYLDRLVRGYDAGVTVADLGSDALHDALDPWVKEHTGGLVPRSALSPDPGLDLVVQDAVVLAAAWEEPFAEMLTYDESFSTAAGRVVETPMMHADRSLAVVEHDGWTAVRLPYTDDLAADLLLPPAGSAAADAPAQADAALVASLSVALDEQERRLARIALPVLDLTTATDLMPLLTDLGIAGSALSGLVDESVVISQGAQQAVLQVDEEGTRAAAVTEIAAGAAAPPEPQLQVRFDRPFLFVARDGTTGWPVFLAAVTDPSA